MCSAKAYWLPVENGLKAGADVLDTSSSDPIVLIHTKATWKHFDSLFSILSFKSAVRLTAVPSLPLVSVTVGCAQVPSVTGSIWWGSHHSVSWVVSTQPLSPCTFRSCLVMLTGLLLPLFVGRRVWTGKQREYVL